MRAERQRWRRRLGAQPRQGPRAGAAFFSTRRWPRSKGAASHFVVVIEESKIVPASVALVPIRSRSARLGRQSRVQRHVRATLWPEPWLCALQPVATPDPMGLSLKKLQSILNMEQAMDNDCFNTVVHILACDEGVLFTYLPIHYMDLRFCSMMLELTRVRSFARRKLSKRWQYYLIAGLGWTATYHRATLNVSGYFVFYFMLWWNGIELVKPVLREWVWVEKAVFIIPAKTPWEWS